MTGSDRLPLIDDIPRMPYVRGCVKEVLRIRPVTSGGSPHLATADISYGGYIIPAGSVVQGNHWAINRDLSKFDDPEEFRPDRWDAKEPMEEGIGSFGYGRRVCPGACSLFAICRGACDAEARLRRLLQGSTLPSGRCSSLPRGFSSRTISGLPRTRTATTFQSTRACLLKLSPYATCYAELRVQ